jgi:glucose-6-phosphate 1-dehydrogenase
MASPPADALVFFGATGDLAYKQIFPALQTMAGRGHLTVPVVGVAKAGWTLDQLRARARDSVEKHGGLDNAAFTKLMSLLRYVDGDYREAATFQTLRTTLGGASSPLHYLAIPPSMFAVVADGLAQAGLAQNARVVVEKPFGRDLASAQALNRTLHPCCSSASRIRSWSRSGTAISWRASGSPWRRVSAWKAAVTSTKKPGQSGT